MTTVGTSHYSTVKRGDYTFRIHITPESFVSKVNPGQSLLRVIDGATAIVSPRDISHMVGLGEKSGSLTIISMPRCEIYNLFRGIQDSEGVRVYGNAEIVTSRVSPSMLYHGQTFVQAEKIVGLSGLKKLFDQVDNSGVSKTPSSIIIYENGKEKYVALYFPVIVELMNKSLIVPVLENLKVRAETDPIIKLRPFGNGQESVVDLRRIVAETQQLMDNSNIQTIHIVRDGTHRSHTTNIAGTTMQAIVINGATAIPTGIPIRSGEMIVTTEKPGPMGDRYPGYLKKSWMDYKERGIDG
jgi:hypothetical protein